MEAPSARKGSRAALACLLALVVLTIAADRVGASPNGGAVVVVDFDVPVDPGSSNLLSAAVSQAQRTGAPAVLIQMNTPGGLLSDMTGMISTIQEANQSGIPTYTYVPPNALAASAGSYIAMASNKILMGPGSEIGPSTPIVVGGTALEQNHTEGAMVSLMTSLAEKWGRNATAAQQMVTGDRAFSAAEANGVHLADGSASSLPEALSKLGLPPTYVVVQEGPYGQLLSALSNQDVAGLLILLGGIALVLDLLHPTFVLSVVGAVSMVAGFVGAEVVGASYLGLVVILAGVALMFLELYLGHGLAMMAGAAVGAVGIYLLFQGVGLSTSSADFTQFEAIGVAGVGVLSGLYVRWVLGPIRRRVSLTGSESLPGKVGVATTDLSPDGEVRVDGITWRARSASGEVRAGDQVRVTGVEKLALVVEKA